MHTFIYSVYRMSRSFWPAHTCQDKPHACSCTKPHYKSKSNKLICSLLHIYLVITMAQKRSAEHTDQEIHFGIEFLSPVKKWP